MCFFTVFSLLSAINAFVAVFPVEVMLKIVEETNRYDIYIYAKMLELIYREQGGRFSWTKDLDVAELKIFLGLLIVRLLFVVGFTAFIFLFPLLQNNNTGHFSHKLKHYP